MTGIQCVATSITDRERMTAFLIESAITFGESRSSLYFGDRRFIFDNDGVLVRIIDHLEGRTYSADRTWRTT